MSYFLLVMLLAILPGTRHAFRYLDPVLYARLLVPYFDAG